MRWVVGDVHGCARELERLLKAIRHDEVRDELWSIGDLVNKGPDSLAALRLWQDAGGCGVLGNHDAYALGVVTGRCGRRNDTLDELLAAADGEERLRRLLDWPLLVPLACDGAPIWLVHAGLHPAWLDLERVAGRINARPHDEVWFEAPDTAFALRARCCTPEGTMSDATGPPSECEPPYRPWDAYYSGLSTIVHGHWAARGFHRTGRVIGLDSGCVYGGALSAWCVEERRLVQVGS